MTPRRIKDFVFAHFNAFKSLMDRDMGLREEGWGTGEGRREGPCGCWSWRRKEKKKKKKEKKTRVGVQERDEYWKNRRGEFRRGWKDEKQRMTSEHQTWFRAIVTPKGYEHTNAAIFQSALLRIVIFYSSPSEELNLAHHHNTISLQKITSNIRLFLHFFCALQVESKCQVKERKVPMTKMFAKIKCLKIQEPAVRGSVEVIKHMSLFTFWINSKATKHQSCPLLCMCVYVCERWCVCVCVEIKARPVLTPCASLGKIKPSWGQGQWRGGNKCEQKRAKKGERECSEALKSRGGPADIFYVHVEEERKKKKVL